MLSDWIAIWLFINFFLDHSNATLLWLERVIVSDSLSWRLAFVGGILNVDVEALLDQERRQLWSLAMTWASVSAIGNGANRINHGRSKHGIKLERVFTIRQIIWYLQFLRPLGFADKLTFALILGWDIFINRSCGRTKSSRWCKIALWKFSSLV